jgi:PAS domain S-box-containing protein
LCYHSKHALPAILSCDRRAVIEDTKPMSALARSHFSRWFARPLIPVIAALLTLSAATGFLGLQNWRDREAVDLSLEHGRQVIDTLDRLRTIIVDLEAERHGYLLTLDPSYLKAYGVSDESVRREAEALQALVANDPLQSFRAGHLALIISEKLREIDDFVKTAARVSAQAAQAMIRGMDDIRLQIDLLQDVERFRLVGWEKRAGELERGRTRLTLAAGVIGAVLVGSAMALARLEAKRRRKATEENVQLHSDLLERDRKIRRLVDSNIIGVIIWELEGRILEANDAFLRIVGYDREDLAAGRLHRAMLTPPEWRDLDGRNMAGLELIGTVAPFEKEYLRKDGSRVAVLIGGAMFQEGTNQGVGFVLDLTELKRAEKALRQSEERFRTLVQFSFDVYWESDAQHRFTHQEFAESLVDAPAPGSEIGKTRWEVPYLEPDAEAWRKHRETLDAHLPFRDFELARPTLDGGKRYVSVSGLPVFDETGRFVGYRGVGRHITERKRAEEALRSAHAELAHAHRITTMGQLAASIAHEVNQPITATVANAEAGLSWLAAQPPNLEQVRQSLDCIVSDGLRAGDVIGRIRALVRKEPQQRTAVDINAVVVEVIALTRIEIARNRVMVRTQLSEALPTIQADRVQLQQVILNLIMNAVEAMSGMGDGERELSISTIKDASNSLTVCVRDSGPGLDAKTMDRVFDAFFTTKSKGMGMGLAICYSIIEAHGGRLWAGANEPQGATFQFTLPLVEGDTVPPRHVGQMPAI